jgi:Integrase core domain
MRSHVRRPFGNPFQSCHIEPQFVGCEPGGWGLQVTAGTMTSPASPKYADGARQHPWGIVAALLAGWTLLPIALWGAALGGIIGFFDATLTDLGTRHTRIRPGRPQTNGHVENLHKTILDECWRPSFARYLHVSYGGLRADPTEYLHLYNTDRAHTGHITKGRIPTDIIDPAHKMRPRT